jgi:hypothetical protein
VQNEPFGDGPQVVFGDGRHERGSQLSCVLRVRVAGATRVARGEAAVRIATDCSVS